LLASLPAALASRHKILRDIARILGVSAAYAIIFGFLYGELFGVLGHRLFGLTPLLIDRHESIIEMLYFALAIGFIHILVGLILGAVTSFRYKEKREAILKLISIGVILALALIIGAYFSPTLLTLRKPMLIGVLIAIPLLLASGGLLAPLELLKHFGNIISYARIMAIGLTSVLLAHVANSMVGIMGSVWAGVLAGIILHGFNIILGIFAPTIHALRLHYVEFFSKIVSDGLEYRPLAKTDEKGNSKEQNATKPGLSP
jgi:V/A-type H+-transporting ATPase subunit I